MIPYSVVCSLVRELLAPAHFYTAHGLTLRFDEPRTETITWEVFHGRLLDARQTRERASFTAWNVWAFEDGQISTEPLVAVKLTDDGQTLHFVRAIHCHTWEGYNAGGSVYLSRETRTWLRELVGSVALQDMADVADLRAELTILLQQAVHGTSRLPLTSLEAPLPSFSLGQLGYFPGTATAAEPMSSVHELVNRFFGPACSDAGLVKLLEVLFRTTLPEEVPPAVRAFAEQWRAQQRPPATLPTLLRRLINEIALSPYTSFVENLLAGCRVFVAEGLLTVADQLDFLTWMLRHNVRHLTAYDLKTFHQRGANYPDALLLDACLKDAVTLTEQHPQFLLPLVDDDETTARLKRLRRRGLRQGWLLRSWYAGLPVPVLPTSPGENARVLPAAFPRVADEEILQPSHRSRRLYEGEDWTTALPARLGPVWQALLADLESPSELRELGLALFLNRPLGMWKRPTEPDATLLLAHEAFSPTIARQRLAFLAEQLGVIEKSQVERLLALVTQADLGAGLELFGRPEPDRPGVVSLNDLRRAAPDFVLQRTVGRSVQAFLAQFDLTPLQQQPGLEWLTVEGIRLIVPPGRPPGVLTVYDHSLQRQLELEVPPEAGYRKRRGQEAPAAGLRVRSPADQAGTTIKPVHDVAGIPRRE